MLVFITEGRLYSDRVTDAIPTNAAISVEIHVDRHVIIRFTFTFPGGGDNFMRNGVRFLRAKAATVFSAS